MKKIICYKFLVFCFFTYIKGSCYFVLIAAPGSGKGTFSNYVSKYGFKQICPGDLFRAEISAETDLGKRIQPIVDSGRYVDEATVCQLVAHYFSKFQRDHKHIVIDGFPRSKESFDFLDTFLKDKKIPLSSVTFLQLLADDQTCIARITSRELCYCCTRVYNRITNPSLLEGFCDECKKQLSIRKADTQETATNRIAYFHKHIEPLLDEAKSQQYTVKKIWTERPLHELFALYDDILKDSLCS